MNRNIYGSKLLGQEEIYEVIASTDNNVVDINTNTDMVIGDKRYTLSNHLGNVHQVVTDRKIPEEDNGDIAYFYPNVVSYSDFLPFGMEIEARSSSTSDVDFGFNGMYKDDEWKGKGNSYDFGARMYDPRVGRWLSVDPKTKRFANLSPYNAFNSNPTIVADPTGESGVVTITEGTEGNPGTIKISMNVVLYGSGASPELAQDTQNEIMRRFKEHSVNYMVNGQNYNVELDLNVQYMDEVDACDKASTNTDYANNFIRVESFNAFQKMNNDANLQEGGEDPFNGEAGYVSEMSSSTGGIGCNTGFIITSGIVSDPSVLLHELTHGWGAVHQDGLVDCKNSSIVPASLPKNTPSSAVPNAPSTNNEAVLDMSKRTLVSCDLDAMFRYNGFTVNTNGGITIKFNDGKFTRNVGSTDNIIYDEEGFYASRQICGN